ncbi:MAG: right-handed parallel beta-helix repeat-containing protein [Cyclobacteriaceae bacterium]
MKNIRTWIKKLSTAGFLILLAWTLACTPEDEVITESMQAQLAFSTDTVFFDTLFTDTLSFTRRFRVYNRNDNAVNISSIRLAQDQSSPYSIWVNGVRGKSFSDQVLMGGDSLLILAEVTIASRDENTPFFVEDLVEFNTNGNQQSVHLVAWGQDAYFFRQDAILACNTTWPADKPHVLYGSVLVDDDCSLTIEPGAQIFLNQGSSLFIEGTLKAEGTAQDRIRFQNVRLDIKDAPGQWTGIFFLEGTKNNRLDFTVIRNGEVGIRLGAPDNDTIPDVVVSNTIIENMSGTGILAFNSDLHAYNVLIDNCINGAVGNFAGGNYYYEHCTFANYSFGIFAEAPGVVVTDNLILADESLLINDINFQLQNCIVWGDSQMGEELVLNNEGGADFTALLSNNLIRSTEEVYNINSNVLGTSPDFPSFLDPANFDYHLDSLSPAKDLGLPSLILRDLDDSLRDALPDIGAYERFE